MVYFYLIKIIKKTWNIMVKVLQLALEVGNCTPIGTEFDITKEYVLVAELSKDCFR